MSSGWRRNQQYPVKMYIWLVEPVEHPALLVVDDEAAISRIIAVVAKGIGRDTVTVGDAESALTSLSRIRPQMLLVDVRLPGIDGIELTRRLKKEPSLRSTAIVLMSAFGEPARHDGDAFLPKPFDVDQLAEIIERFTSPAAASTR